MSNWCARLPAAYQKKRVFVTGHTGFKGSWLCEWLLHLGAEVRGYSKDVPTRPAAFELLGLEERLQHEIGDVRNLEHLEHAIAGFQPDYLFHLAAQPLVRASYRDPLETFSTNVMGTANVLEALRKRSSSCVVVNVTSDKCYENREWEFGYRETDALGGADPYSASKGCAEIVFSSYWRSFLAASPLRAGSARAGNVIGGGDFAEDRLIPDCVRAWAQGQTVVLRNPGAIRPWQHVLEPLGGYLVLGAALSSGDARVASGAAFNFGPLFDACQPVQSVVQELQRHFRDAQVELLGPSDRDREPHEAKTLKLNIDRAADALGWRPTLPLDDAAEWTATWYRTWLDAPHRLRELTLEQIESFTSRVAR